MSVAEQIQRIQGASADIKAAIESYGVTVNPTDTYAEKIGQISGGEWLPSAETVLATFARRQSGGDGPATIEKIYGKTVVWNQLAGDGRTSKGVTALLVSGVYELSGSITDSYAVIIGPSSRVLVQGHKYLLHRRIVANPNNLSFYVKPLNQQTSSSWDDVIVTATGAGGTLGISNATSGDDFTGVKIEVFLFDLTLMYGEGNEPTSVEEFLALFPDALTASYDAGSLLPVKAEKIVTRGVNLWDEEWEGGTFNTTTGENIDWTSSQQIRSKNLIPVIGGLTYYFGAQRSAGMWVMLYDSNLNIIDASGVLPNPSGKCFSVNRGTATLPSNAAFAKFYLLTSYGTTYLHDICINISNSAINGQYFPYRSSDVGLPILKYFPDGMRGVGDIYDELTPKEAIQRIGSRAYQSGDESDTSVLTDGTTTFYPLADPIVTDIDEQMTYLPDEGGTEEISPITAPFTADIRYARLLNEE